MTSCQFPNLAIIKAGQRFSSPHMKETHLQRTNVWMLKPARNSGQPSQRFKHVFLIAVVLSILLLFIRYNAKLTPSAYTLCSLEGKIYTVNIAQPTVDCIVVDEHILVDAGSFSTLMPTSCSRSEFSHTQQPRLPVVIAIDRNESSLPVCSVLFKHHSPCAMSHAAPQ